MLLSSPVNLACEFALSFSARAETGSGNALKRLSEKIMLKQGAKREEALICLIAN
ncbi:MULTISPECIES: hypothetical protein [unclassified Bradyrhizobium]